MSKLKASPTWQKVSAATGRKIGVDRENNVLRGVVVAEAGPFKTPGRGAFDEKSLIKLVELSKRQPLGLKSRFSHPTMSDDGLSKYLGRVRNIAMDVTTVSRDGVAEQVKAIRGDLHFDRTALEEMPGGGKPLGLYVMDRVESDPDSISTSIVVEALKEHQLDHRGRPLTNDKGEPLPPLWRPTKLHASDLVAVGDAVHGILSKNGGNYDGLPDWVIRQGCELLDAQFGGSSADVIRARCIKWLDRYLSMRFGEGTAKVALSENQKRQRMLAKVEREDLKKRLEQLVKG